jgi:hypothetical protein
VGPNKLCVLRIMEIDRIRSCVAAKSTGQTK